MEQLSHPEYAIFTSGLAKRFGNRNAVDGIDLRVPRGSIFGFLGPNGSGKTTTIRMLLGLANISAGQVSLLGHSVPDQIEKVLPKVGALVEGPAAYPYLSGRDNLMRLDASDRSADPKSRDTRVDIALARVGLTQAQDKKVNAYSLGMKQRLGIANALLQPRELLILDEPTNGLDPQGTREVRNLVRQLASEGITIFISSHLLAEIEQICTHLAIITPDGALAIATLKSLDIDAIQDGKIISAAIPSSLMKPEELSKLLIEAGVGIQAFTLNAPTLEERFVQLTGEGFQVA